MKTRNICAAAAAGLALLGWQGVQAQDCQLDIAPGAVITGGSSADFIVIEQGCKINAAGTLEQPINFTAFEAVTGSVDSNARGLWGGLVINGFAPINDCPEGAQGGTAQCTKEGEANSGTFGGDQPGDNSGVLTYVVVSYAGSNVDPENQLNGIAFQGVGSGTRVENIQVHNNLDDGVEFFGGTVNASNVVLTGNADDSLDWTDGWVGAVQFLYIEQDGGGDNLIEADNREGDENAQPRSIPSITNMSAYGITGENGLRLRRGTGLFLTNSVVTGSTSCLRIEGESLALLGSELTIGGTSLGCTETVTGDDSGAVTAYLDSADQVSQDGGQVEAVPANNAFFEPVSYVGAFGGTNWTAGWTVPGSVSNPGAPSLGCPAGTVESAQQLADSRVCELTGAITANVNLTPGNLYRLIDKVTIGGDNQNSATLTVQPGVTVYGGTSSDFLVISRGSRLVVNGTRSAPVTFTALADLLDTVGETSRGLWGGIVINGNAPINDCPEGAEGGTSACTKEGEANSGLFGGADPGDSSGSLKYLVVKYAGSNVDPENQLNGIAFQGVGSGTSVEFVQVYNNLDDGIEFFGGTVNAKYIVLTGNADDSLDWTDGWQGSIQYLQIDQADDAGDNGIEADNREGDENAQPRSMPSIANMTINGNIGERGIRLRRGTGAFIYNSYVTRNAICLDISGESLALLETDIVFDGVSLDCPETVEGGNVQVQAFLDNSNVSQDGGAVAPADLSGNAFFDDTAYIGAVQDPANDWVAGWTVGMPDTTPPVLGCPAGTTDGPSIAGTPSCNLSGTIVADVTLTRGNYYVLNGKVVVGGDNTSSAVLTIESGTTVIGDDDDDFLVISRGSKIVASGTNMAPVTLTAIEDVTGGANLDNARGLWGGLVINGNAPINDCPEGAQGGTAQCTKEGEANSGLFGGADPADNSGELKYVVVKYAGSNVDPENQLNGIAFQAVGSGTTVDYVQVHNNLDDGIEMFGGSVNLKHIVLSGNADDSMDWTDGWIGSAQFVHIAQAGAAGDNGIEADNREGDEAAQPRSMPAIANMSILGNPGERGILLRRGTGADIYNSLVSGSATCIEVAGESVALLGTDINLASVSFGCATVSGGVDPQLQSYLDGAPGVTQNGSIPPVTTLPNNGFFQQTNVIGSDFNSWRGAWVFGL